MIELHETVKPSNLIAVKIGGLRAWLTQQNIDRLERLGHTVERLDQSANLLQPFRLRDHWS